MNQWEMRQCAGLNSGNVFVVKSCRFFKLCGSAEIPTARFTFLAPAGTLVVGSEIKKFISTNEAYCHEDTYFVLERKVNIFTGCKVIPQSKNAQKSRITIYAICSPE